MYLALIIVIICLDVHVICIYLDVPRCVSRIIYIDVFSHSLIIDLRSSNKPYASSKGSDNQKSRWAAPVTSFEHLEDAKLQKLESFWELVENEWKWIVGNVGHHSQKSVSSLFCPHLTCWSCSTSPAVIKDATLTCSSSTSSSMSSSLSSLSCMLPTSALK